MHELTEIAQKLENRKATDHLYTELFGPLFEPYREFYTDVLEVGVHRGLSLLIWSQYFPNAHVYGVENLLYHQALGSKVTYENGETGFFLEEVINNERISIQIGNAYEKEMVEKLSNNNKKYDLIMDDGSHEADHQLFFLNNYVSMLKKNGMLLIEDIPNMGQAYFVADNFTGDSGRLSIIDRRLNRTPRVVANPHKSKMDINYDEIIILYM